MFSRKLVGLTGMLLAVAFISSPVTTMAGTVKAKCQAEAKKQNTAKKDMGEFMKKCYAEHKAKKAKKKEKKEEMKGKS